MNYYKKKELEQRDKGKLVELPPVISNNFKTLEQLSQEYQQLKDKKRWFCFSWGIKTGMYHKNEGIPLQVH